MADLSREELLDELADMEEQVPFLRMRCAEARVDLSERITRTVSVYGTADPFSWPADSFRHVQQMEDATSALEVRLAEAVAYRDELRLAVGGYASQCARDAQSMGYGDRSYWDTLESSACGHRSYFLARGDTVTADLMLTRSLSEALMGNNGD